MVLGGRPPGRVGRRRAFSYEAPPSRSSRGVRGACVACRYAHARDRTGHADDDAAPSAVSGRRLPQPRSGAGRVPTGRSRELRPRRDRRSRPAAGARPGQRRAARRGEAGRRAAASGSRPAARQRRCDRRRVRATRDGRPRRSSDGRPGGEPRDEQPDAAPTPATRRSARGPPASAAPRHRRVRPTTATPATEPRAGVARRGAARRATRPAPLRIVGERASRCRRSRTPAPLATRPAARRRRRGPAGVEHEILRLGAARGDRCSQLMDAADAFAHDRDREALTLLRPLRDALPDTPTVRELAGLAQYRLGNYRAAAKELEALRRAHRRRRPAPRAHGLLPRPAAVAAGRGALGGARGGVALVRARRPRAASSPPARSPTAAGSTRRSSCCARKAVDVRRAQAAPPAPLVRARRPRGARRQPRPRPASSSGGSQRHDPDFADVAHPAPRSLA